MRTSIVGLLLLLLAASCGRERRVDVPRQYAFPRIEVPDSAFAVFDNFPTPLQVNTSSKATITRENADGVWADIEYPSLNAQIFLTYIPIANQQQFASVVDNRAERIALNLGGNDAEVLSLTSGVYDSEIYVAAGRVTTPVQFIAVCDTAIISGMAFLPAAQEAVGDSLQPVVDLLRRDVLHMMKTLGQ